MPEPLVNARPRVYVREEERPDIAEGLEAMVAELPLAGMSHAELTLINLAPSGDAGVPDYPFLDIELGDSLLIDMGMDGDGQSTQQEARIFDGQITAIEERHGGGAPKLVLLAEDRLHHLARHRQSRSYEDQTPDDIVRALASDSGLEADVNVSGLQGTYHQINESDLAFLLRLTSRFDVSPRLMEGRLRARAEERDRDPFRLDGQGNAVRIRLLTDLNHQPVETRVLGFNPGTDEPVEGRGDSLQPSPAGRTASDTLRNLGWNGEDVMPQPFAASQGEADAYAQAHFGRRARRFVSGEVRCVGDARLVAGREIDLVNVSPRMEGRYQVIHCLHRFDGQAGYQTVVQVQRPGWSV